MASRSEYPGPATLTPFLPQATFTREAAPEVIGEESGGNDSAQTSTSEPLSAENLTETAAAEKPSTTPSTPTAGETLTTITAASTQTLIPSWTPSSSSAAQESSTSTTAPTSTAEHWDTSTPETPSAPTGTSAPSDTPAPTSVPHDTNTPIPTNTPVSQACSPAGNASYESQVINLINQERTSRGLTALTLNSSLRQAARGHSEDMACNDFFSHTGSDGSSMSSRILAAGYSYSWAAENIAASSSCSFSPSSVVNMWMNSAGHKANILNTNAVHIGVGFRCNSDGKPGDLDAYYTANFGKP